MIDIATVMNDRMYREDITSERRINDKFEVVDHILVDEKATGIIFLPEKVMDMTLRYGDEAEELYLSAIESEIERWLEEDRY